MGYARFGESAWYPKFTRDDHDLNKLVGISFGMFNKKSMRLAWKPSDDDAKIKVYSYVDDGKETRWQYITSVNIGERFWFSLWTNRDCVYYLIHRGKYGYSVMEKLPKGITMPEKYWGYLQSPYFGGDNKAPQCIKIEFNDIKCS